MRNIIRKIFVVLIILSMFFALISCEANTGGEINNEQNERNGESANEDNEDNGDNNSEDGSPMAQRAQPDAAGNSAGSAGRFDGIWVKDGGYTIYIMNNLNRVYVYDDNQKYGFRISVMQSEVDGDSIYATMIDPDFDYHAEYSLVLDGDRLNFTHYYGIGLQVIETSGVYTRIPGDAQAAYDLLRDGGSPPSTAPPQSAEQPTEPEPEPVTSVNIGGVEYGLDWTTFQLSDTELTDEDLAQLKYLTRITTLEFNASKITDFSPLGDALSLRGLRISDADISDLSPIANLVNLTALSINQSGISDITPLGNLTNVTSMFLNDNQISDVSVLAGLSNLAYLGLASNQISDITPLLGLTGIVHINLYGNPVSPEDLARLRAALPNCGIYFGDENVNYEQSGGMTPRSGN